MKEFPDKMLPPPEPAPGADSTVSAKPALLERIKRPAISVGVVALALAGGFLWAKVVGDQALSEAEGTYEATLSSKQASLHESDAALNRAQARGKILAAYRDLHLALMALEERNFGTSSMHLKQAGKRLATVAEPGAGQREVQTAREVAAEISDWRPDVTEDVGQQRSKVLGFLRRLDPLVDAGSE